MEKGRDRLDFSGMQRDRFDWGIVSRLNAGVRKQSSQGSFCLSFSTEFVFSQVKQLL